MRNNDPNFIRFLIYKNTQYMWNNVHDQKKWYRGFVRRFNLRTRLRALIAMGLEPQEI